MDNIIDKYIILYLQVLNNNDSIDILLKRGLEYSQIVRITDFALETGYIEVNNNQIRITTKGQEFYKNLIVKHNLKGSDKRLSPLLERKIKKIQKEDIYIPPLENINYNNN